MERAIRNMLFEILKNELTNEVMPIKNKLIVTCANGKTVCVEFETI